MSVSTIERPRAKAPISESRRAKLSTAGDASGRKRRVLASADVAALVEAHRILTEVATKYRFSEAIAELEKGRAESVGD
jgi:hypothetical protein